MKDERNYTLYILRCGIKGQYYTGITTDLTKRIKSHQLADPRFSDKIKQWTAYHQPVELAFKYEGLHGLSIALRVERYVKSLKNEFKTSLIKGDCTSFSRLVRFHQRLLH